MHTVLVSALHSEERMILAELRTSLHFRRLEEIRRLLGLYTAQPPIGATLDAMLADGRDRPVLHLVPTPQVIALQGDHPTTEVA
jgi:hypothetical protein